jgi:hypothetical protein
MKLTRHWHVVEDKVWDGDCYRHSYTCRPVEMTEQESRELERTWAQKRLLEAKRNLIDAMAQVEANSPNTVDIARLLGAKPR